MSSFFSSAERLEPLVIPPVLRFSLLFVWLLVMVLIAVFRKRLAALRRPELPMKIAAVILLVDQIVLYCWQFFSGYFRASMSLPLYHCRIAVPLLILDIVFGCRVLRSVWVYWAVIGSAFAMGFMDLYRFPFPHYTNFQFFIVHLLLGWIIMYVIFVLNYRFEKKSLKTALLVTFLYNVFLIVFNGICNGTFLPFADASFNYGYMTLPPMAALKAFALTLPPFVYNLIIAAGYELLIVLLYAAGRMLNRLHDRGLSVNGGSDGRTEGVR